MQKITASLINNSYAVLCFLIVFICLPFPHSNIYPFFLITALCAYKAFKKEITLKKTSFFIPLIIFIFISIFYSSDKIFAFKLFTKIIFLFLGGWLWWNKYSSIKDFEKLKIQQYVFIAAILIITLIAIDIFYCFIIRGHYSGGMYVLIKPSITNALAHACVASSLAIWIGLKKLSKLSRTMLLSIFCVVILTATSDAAALAIVFGAATLVIYKFFPHFVKLAFTYGMPAVWLAFPFIFKFLNYEHFFKWSSSIDPSYTHRLFIWHSAATQIFKNFWFGSGLVSSRCRSVLNNAQDIVINSDTSKIIMQSPETCLHPHNFMLQTYVELGFVGVVIACLIWVTYWKHRYQKLDSYTMGFWGSALCVAATGISIWQTWWLVLLATLAPIYSQKVSENNHLPA